MKIKIKSLAEEAKIIRSEAAKPHNWQHKRNLLDHKIRIVRPEIRHAALAYAFLRGTPYRSVEKKCHLEPNWERVLKLVLKYIVSVPAIWELKNKNIPVEPIKDYNDLYAKTKVEFENWKNQPCI